MGNHDFNKNPIFESILRQMDVEYFFNFEIYLKQGLVAKRLKENQKAKEWMIIPTKKRKHFKNHETLKV